MDKYLHKFKRKTFMENTIDFGTSWKFQRINLISWAFNSFFKVHWKLLYHPKCQRREGKEKKANKTQNNLRTLTTNSYFTTIQLVLPIQTYLAITKSVCTTDSANLPIHRIPTCTRPPCIPAVLQYSLTAFCESSAGKFRRDWEGTSFPHAKRQAQEPVWTRWCVRTTSSSLLDSALTSAGAFRKTHRRVLQVMEKSEVMSLCFCSQNIWSKVTRTVYSFGHSCYKNQE